MPHSDIHKQKKKKNFTLLGLIFLWCLLIFFLTMVKMARADEAHSHGSDWRGGSVSGDQHHPKSWKIPQGAYHEDRMDHREKMDQNQINWETEHNENAPIHMGKKEEMDSARAKHHNYMEVTSEEYVLQYDNKAQERSDMAEEQLQEREAHMNTLNEQPKEWWDSWIAEYSDPDYDRSE